VPHLWGEAAAVPAVRVGGFRVGPRIVTRATGTAAHRSGRGQGRDGSVADRRYAWPVSKRETFPPSSTVKVQRVLISPQASLL